MEKQSLRDAGAVFRAGTIRREHVFVTTKLWNTDYRPQRVEPAFDAGSGD
jgi:diketogulonate reductase-like aldo/keto reductase